jgi:GH25 family lysozyme M1 (1,4-beta-N-acetylmuramidase)
MATSRGIDVSSYQGVQDWSALTRGGLTFGFAKASEGQHTHDSHFSMHITGIIAAGLVPGAYHFAWPNQNAATEAANYVAAVKPHARRGFVHVLDLERRPDGANYAGCTAASVKTYAAAWVAAVQKAFPGQRVGVYTSGSDIAAGHLPSNADFLWYPAYPSGEMSFTEAEGRPKPAPSGLHPLFWQFTSTPVDRNLAYLSPEALRAWAAGDIEHHPDQNDQEDEMPEAKDLWAYKGLLNGKPDPHDAYAYLRGTNASVQALTKKVGTLTATVDTLAKVVASTKGIDAQTLIAEIRAAIADAAIDVDVTVHDSTPPATA